MGKYRRSVGAAEGLEEWTPEAGVLLAGAEVPVGAADVTLLMATVVSVVPGADLIKCC